MSDEEKQETPEGMISVIDEFDYSTQSKEYGIGFRKWRKKKENPFSFSFERNPKESVYVDGRGFMVGSAKAAEKEALIRVFYVIGNAALMWIVIDNIIGKLLIQILSIAGMNIHTNYFSNTIYGGPTEIVLTLILITSLKILVPALYLQLRLRLPLGVAMMNSKHDSQGLVGSIGVMLIICSLLALPSAYSGETKEIYTFFRSLNTDVSVWDQTEYTIYTLFDVIVVAAGQELFFRGAMFAVLRQFGDKFAIIMTVITEVLLVKDIHDVPSTILVALVASFGMLRSGTIFTAVAVDVVYKAYVLAIAVMEGDTSQEMLLTRNLFMVLMLCLGALMLLLAWILSKMRYRKTLAEVEYELTLQEKVIHSLKVFPYSAVAAISLVYTIVRAVL